MRKLLFVLSLLAIPIKANAQTPIIIGPNSTFIWDMPTSGMTVAVAQGCIYPISVNGAAPVPLVGPVTCIPPVPPSIGPTCSVLVSAQPATTFPITAASVTLAASCSGITTLPSTPFSYVVIFIPIPTNLRIK